MSALLDLAARCEAAEGPDRELDIAIWRSVLANEQQLALVEQGRTLHGDSEADFRADYMMDGKRFTASLDAALTLVPEGAGVRLDRYWIANVDGPVWSCSISQGGVPENPRKVFETWDHLTPALALCAAALTARQSQEPPHEG